MRQTRDTAWQRSGTSWIWHADALAAVCKPTEVWSLRQFFYHQGKWPETLPSNGGNTLVVAGLDSCLDLMTPADAESWIATELKRAILDFQSQMQSQAALVFWLPTGSNRMKVNPVTDDVNWFCAAPHQDTSLQWGRMIWGQANEYPQEILFGNTAKVAGLYHRHIS